MDKLGKFFAGWLIGSIIGAALGLLFAPSSGSQTRRKIMNNIHYIRDEVQKATAQRSEELKRELAEMQKKA